MGRSLPFALTVASLVATTTTGGTAGSPATRADLVETSLSISKHTVRAGTSLKVTDVARNRGLAAAPRSAVGYYLSRDRFRSRGDRRLARRAIGALPSGRTSKGSRIVVIPASTARGRYRVLACADDRHRIREVAESNNCRSTAKAIVVTRPPGTDSTPPTFAGLLKATTCIPGPIGTGRSSTYHLTWNPATDAVAPSSEIVYDVYQATAAGGESFSTPTYTTPAGAAAFDTPPLASTKTYYFVVRARDLAGNRDSNRVERAGENLCL
jgi:hypothetical protein